MTRVLSITPWVTEAIRRAIRDHATVDYGVKGTTRERPWAVIAPGKERTG